MVIPTVANASVKGDVDCDGEVKITDVVVLMDYLLTGKASGISLVNADSDFDGRVSITDVTCLIDFLLTGSWCDVTDEHEWVDLCLPSGTLWATYNVGASKPEDCGEYYAWGETEPRDVYDWYNYKWSYYDSNGHMYYTKYFYSYYLWGEYYEGDGKTELDPEDDAAYVNWGSSWRMPTHNQQQELRENCTWIWTTLNGVNGFWVIGLNGNSIFLPAAGEYGYSLYFLGVYGYYWSRSLYDGDSFGAYNMYFSTYDVRLADDYQRATGYTIRAVRMP